MAVEKHLSTPSAILLAGAMIAAAVFFGLRGREPPPGAPPVPPRSSSPEPVASAVSQGSTAQVPPPPAVADHAVVAEAAARELERHRAEVVRRCVAPALAQRPEPPHVKLTFDVTFDAQGRQIARGVTEDRATARPGVTACATDLVPELRVPPPGAAVLVELRWTLP
jgi:hypothetical protein